jgi:hypothetical protein
MEVDDRDIPMALLDGGENQSLICKSIWNMSDSKIEPSEIDEIEPAATRHSINCDSYVILVIGLSKVQGSGTRGP